MTSPGELLDMARCCQVVAVTEDDRIEFGRSLILQGYTPDRAEELARTLENNAGALQMLARHRIRFSAEASHG